MAEQAGQAGRSEAAPREAVQQGPAPEGVEVAALRQRAEGVAGAAPRQAVAERPQEETACPGQGSSAVGAGDPRLVVRQPGAVPGSCHRQTATVQPGGQQVQGLPGAEPLPRAA